jgi:predicted O-methyltransferase YrrM
VKASAIPNMARRYRHLSYRQLAASVAARGMLPMLEPVLRKRMAPSFRQVVTAGRAAGTAAAFVQTLLGEELATASRIDELAEDFAAAMDALRARYAITAPDCRLDWVVGDRSALALYLVVRLTRPDVIIETGVAGGHSSFLLLSALESNGHGRLVSFDVLPDAGSLVPSHLRPRWQLVILRSADPLAEVAARISVIGKVDVFFHDADHSYVGQYADYAVAEKVLMRGRLGILLSDDVDMSFAFMDYIRARQLDAAVLVDVGKVLGGCRVRRTAPARR